MRVFNVSSMVFNDCRQLYKSYKFTIACCLPEITFKTSGRQRRPPFLKFQRWFLAFISFYKQLPHYIIFRCTIKHLKNEIKLCFITPCSRSLLFRIFPKSNTKSTREFSKNLGVGNSFTTLVFVDNLWFFIDHLG